MFNGGKRIAPDRQFAPPLAFFFAFIGGAHGSPGDAIRMADVLCGALPSFLMNQIQITESWFSAGLVLTQQSLRGKFVSAGNRIVARIANASRPVLLELTIPELEQPDIRSSALLRIEAGLDL